MFDQALILSTVIVQLWASELGGSQLPLLATNSLDVEPTGGGLHAEGNKHVESAEHESDNVNALNTNLSQPGLVTSVDASDNNERDSDSWEVTHDRASSPGQHDGREERRRRPHRAHKTRKHRGRERRWKKNKAAKKRYHRGNRTFKWEEAKKLHKSGGGLRARQRNWNSPNRQAGWVAGQPYRSLDPRRVKVRRHLVRQHNLLRSKVDPPAGDMLAVKWYKTAAEQAQAWAEQCGQHSHPEHPSVRWTSSYGACGQNVLVSPRKKRWTQVLEHWWNGRRHFRYGGLNNSSQVAAYTQMAWYNSHQLGCGFSQCYTPGGSTFFRYVCNYCPAGNDPERLGRPYSKGEACSLCPGACRSLCPHRGCFLCTNACAYSDLWVNCGVLNQQWHEWLCNTKTRQGVERFKNCRATCQCVNEIT